ncbi:MAG: hypothetical protein A2V74_04410 [Acidobacteria bacterium RBG_16_70_10]|nr:MAG: hypothetical protein A2V74_04410 [Acidobacteria bacterium RBG_16_70_10]
MDFARVAGLVAGFLEDRGCPVAVVGAFGLHAWGLQRATLDLDLVTHASAQTELLAHLEGLGYETLHASAGYSNHLHRDAALGRVDVVYVTGETARRLFEGCRPLLELGGRRLRVPRAEHIAAMKVQAMKNDRSRLLQDMADIGFLLRRGDVDRDEVRLYFERAGLLEKWDELVRAL